ncbi:MAG: DUF2179 domain-containing protein [Bellilinea sp.]
MELTLLTSPASAVLLPILIFFARVFDVTLGTVRIIFIARGKKYLAPLLGFVETFVWIVVVSQIVKSINGIWAFVGYAAGFAAGTLVGMYVEDRLAIGTLIVRTILAGDVHPLVQRLHTAGYGVTCVPGEGAQGPVTVVYTVIKRKDIQAVMTIIHDLHPHAFLSIEQVQTAQAGVFPVASSGSRLRFLAKRK